MNALHYQNGTLFFENVDLTTIIQQFGTPCYVYSQAMIENNWHAFDRAFNVPHQICYAVKANSTIAILKLLAKLGSGFDIVSGGELARVLQAGANPQQIVFSGVGKSSDEILSALKNNIGCFNVESEMELERLNFLSTQQNIQASIALRINPDIDAKTHPYISTGLKNNKFGIDSGDVLALCQQIRDMPHIHLRGLACHIGSQLTELQPFLVALDKLITLADELRQQGFDIETLNIGGGLGIRYHKEQPPSIADYVTALCDKLKNLPYQLIIEPGRSIVATAGILLTTVEYLKHSAHKNFAVVDAAMNDYMRPALYDAWQEVLPLKEISEASERNYDIVGPICESGDFLAKDRRLSLAQGDVLAICTTGAYGFSMSSNYNSRPRACEVLIDDNRFALIQKRQTIQDLLSQEQKDLQWISQSLKNN